MKIEKRPVWRSSGNDDDESEVPATDVVSALKTATESAYQIVTQVEQ